MPDDDDTNVRFRFATPDDIHAIVSLDRRYLPADTVIDEDTFESWRRKAPQAFTTLLLGDTVHGYFSLLALRPETMARFVAGEITERDFGAADLLAPNGVPGAGADLYFYSIVVTPAARPLLGDVVQQLSSQIRRHHDRRPIRRVYATAATPAGRRLLERLGFDFVASAGGRADAHDLYALESPALDHMTYGKALTT